MIRRVYFTLILCGFLAHGAQAAVPSYQEVKKRYQRSDALLLDRHGEVIHELRISRYGRRLDWIALDAISPALQDAIVRAEDRRFYDHRGVDWRAIGVAFLASLAYQRPRGASTITMQLAAQLDKTLQAKESRRSLRQKWQQMQAARRMEKSWTKSQILEAYLNLVTFRGELQGIAAAAGGLFGKEPHGLDELESLVLASLVRAPNASLERVVKRACLLGAAVESQIDCEEVASQTKEVLSAPYHPRPQVALAPHVAQHLLKARHEGTSRGPTFAVSTLDGRVQRFAADVLEQHLLTVWSQNVQDGAVLVVENRSGDVLAYIGNSGDLASAPYVDAIHAKRQAGSTLKPFLYGLAFEEKLLTPASTLDDSPLDISVVRGIYRPRNYDSKFQGAVTARNALASSLNVPAVKTLNLVGIEPFLQKLRQLGFKDLNEDGDFYGPSLALGSADVSLWELVNGYRAVANEGLWSELRLTPDKDTKSSPKRVFSRQAAFLVSNVLSDRESRSYTFGLESPLSTRFWSAVKTGTSKDMRDNWCIGYSRDYTVGVWVGNFSGEPMWNVTGITGAAPVWLEIMNWLHRNRPSHPKEPPAGVVAKTVAERGVEEWFIEGTEPQLLKQAADPINPRILYPVTGTVIALDPDIPEEQQRLFFESQPKELRLKWMLNGEPLGSAGSTLLWSPKAGKYHLSLVDPEERVLDEVAFEVRGVREQ